MMILFEGTPEVGRDRQKKYFTKLKPYDHRKEPFESYFQRFETHAKHYKWDDDEEDVPVANYLRRRRRYCFVR